MINAMVTICPICEEGKLKEVKKKTLLEFKNPGQVVIEAKMQECNVCGENFLDEKESPSFAKKADKLYKSRNTAKKIEVKEGDILLL